MERATINDLNKIFDLYASVIKAVDKTDVKLGWQIERYPNKEYIEDSIKKGEMFILKEGDSVIAVAVVNHNVNKEYDQIDWKIKGPKEKISTIHTLCTAINKRGHKTSDAFLKDIADYCKEMGDLAIHLDVIDTNIPAYKLYTRNGYIDQAYIPMYYEIVGTRHFWMLEKVL